MNETNTDTINTGGFGLNDEIPPEPLAQSAQPTGLPCPKCDRTFKNGFALRMHNVRTHGKGWDTGGNFGKKKNKSGVKWSKAQRAHFNRTLAAKKAAASNNHAPGTREATTPVINPGVQFCPRCGCNIKNVAAAIAFGDRQ